MIGLAAFLSVKSIPLTAIFQIAGNAVRMRVNALEEQLQNGSGLDGILRRYTQALLTQIAQSVVCNRLDGREARALAPHVARPCAGKPDSSNSRGLCLGVRRASASRPLHACRKRVLSNSAVA
jgi:hypothetical protein